MFLPKHGVSRDDTVDAPAWGAVSAAVNGCPTEIEVARSLLIMGDLALLYNDILGPSSTTSAAKSASYVICADVLTVIHAIATADGAAGCREEHTSRSAQHSAVTPSCFLSNSVKQLNVSLPGAEVERRRNDHVSHHIVLLLLQISSARRRLCVSENFV